MFKHLKKTFLDSYMMNVMLKFQNCGLKGVATIEKTYTHTHTETHIHTYIQASHRTWVIPDKSFFAVIENFVSINI